MNAITDMTMDGIICKDCGNFIDGESPGYERNCGCIEPKESNNEKTLFNEKTTFIKKIKDLFKK